MPVLIPALCVALALALLSLSKKSQRKQRVSELCRQSRATQLNRTLKLTTTEPNIPLPPKPKQRKRWHSRNSNTPEIQARIAELRQLYPGKSEAWLWDKAVKRTH